MLRRASSCLRFSRRRRDASATGEAICARACRGNVRTCCRRGVPDRHSNEWGDHSASAALAALGSSHPFLEPCWTLGAPGSQAGGKTSTGNLLSLSGGGQVCVHPRLGLLTASLTGAAHPALPGHRANPRGVLPARPNPPLLRLRLRLPDPRAHSESHRRTGAHRARRRCFSFKKKPSPSASGGCGLDLQREDSCLRLRARNPVQSPPGIVVSLGPERLCGILLLSLLLLVSLSVATKQTRAAASAS